MSRSLLQIAAFSNAIEAEHLRLLLQRHGIAAFLDSANTATALSHLGSAVGGAKVLVSPDDADRALEVIRAADEPEGAGDQVWFCGQCCVDVDAEFEVCWSCGQPRANVEQPFPPSPGHAAHADREDADEDTTEAKSAHASPEPTDRNPYASPTARCVSESTSPESGRLAAPSLEAEAMLVRAWRASIIGFFIVPIVFHCYSMYLLIRASLTTDRFSAKGTRQYYQAWAVNVFSGLVWGMFFALSLHFMM